MTKLLTSFTELTTGEGARIAYTYSEIDDNGDIIAQNKKANFVVLNAQLQAHIDAIRTYIIENKLLD